MIQNAHSSKRQTLNGHNLYPSTLSISFAQQQYTFDVPEGVWNPTPHGIHLGNALTSIDFADENVLELGCGCGIHTVLIAQNGAKKITATEIIQAALDNTQHNIEKHHINTPIDYQIADWTHVMGGPWDSLVTNPPFAKSGKAYRRYFIDALINDSHKLVKPSGRLIFVQSSMADIAFSIELMKKWNMTVTILSETSGPFRDYYYEDKQFMQEIEQVPDAYFIKDGKHHEKLVVFEARLSQ